MIKKSIHSVCGHENLSSVNSSWLKDDVTLGSIAEFTILCLFTVWVYASRIASSFSHEFPDKISILCGCTSWITISIWFQSLPAKWTHKLGGPPLPPTSYMYLYSPSLVSLVLCTLLPGLVSFAFCPDECPRRWCSKGSKDLQAKMCSVPHNWKGNAYPVGEYMMY